MNDFTTSITIYVADYVAMSAVALSLAHATLRALEQPAQRRSVAFIAMACAIATITVLRPNRAEAQDTAPTATDAPKPLVAGPTITANARDIPRRDPNTILGRVVDEHDLAIADAEIQLVRIDPLVSTRQLIAQKKSDADGRFRFDNVIATAKESPDGRIPPSDLPDNEFIQCLVRTPDRVAVIRTQLPQYIAQHGDAYWLRLLPAAKLEGRVTDPDGNPVAGALVSAGSGIFGVWEGVMTARTDSDGKYAINDVAPFDQATFLAEQEARNREALRSSRGKNDATVRIAPPPMLTVEHPDFAVKKANYEMAPGVNDVQLEPPAVIEGRVVFVDTQTPAAGEVVVAVTSTPRNFLQSDEIQLQNEIQLKNRAQVRTDADGRFRFTTLPAGKYDLWVDSREWLNAGTSNLETATGKTTPAPDLTLTKGVLINVRLVDINTRQPVQISPNTNASILVLPPHHLLSRPMSRFVAAKSDGTFELRTLPGENKFVVAGVSVGGQPKWVGILNGLLQPGVQVKEGETTSFDVFVTDVKETPNSATGASNELQIDVFGKPREAIELLTQKLKERPDDPELLLLRCEAYDWLREYGKAIADLESVIRNNPSPSLSFVAHNNLAVILSTRPVDSIRDGKRAVELALRPATCGRRARDPIYSIRSPPLMPKPAILKPPSRSRKGRSCSRRKRGISQASRAIPQLQANPRTLVAAPRRRRTATRQ